MARRSATVDPAERRGWLTANVRVLSGASFLQDKARELLYPTLPIFPTVTWAPRQRWWGWWKVSPRGWRRRLPV